MTPFDVTNDIPGRSGGGDPAATPSTAEMLTVALVSRPLLGLPWGYAVALGWTVQVDSIKTRVESAPGTELETKL